MTLLAATAAFAFATPAMAQDSTGDKIGSGPRVELLLGYDYVRAPLIEDDGALFGIAAGYDYAVANNVSIGAEVEASDSAVKDNSFGVDLKSGRDLYAGARVSLAVADGANIYVKGGYTNARFKADGFGGENFGGWRLGAGLQVDVLGKIYTGGEYRYSNYESGISRQQLAVKVGYRF